MVKKIYLDLSNYFSLHTKKLISSENDKRIGITVSVMYKDQINVSYVMNLYYGEKDTSRLIAYTMNVIWDVLKKLNKERNYQMYVYDNEFVAIINRCLREMKKNDAGCFINIFGDINTKVTIEEIKARRIKIRNGIFW